MKTRTFLLALFAMVAFGLNAQTDSTYYLHKALQKLEEGDCEAAQKSYNIYKELDGEEKPSVQISIDDCFAGKQQQSNSKKSKIDLTDNSYCKANKNRYIAWTISGAGYPWNLVTGIEFRGGNIIGIGLYGDIGMDFTSVTAVYTEYSKTHDVYGHTTKTSFRYAGGLKFYPYKGLFLDCGYGTIAPATAKVQYNFGGSIDSNEAKTIREKVTTGHGILFHAGYNYVTELPTPGLGFFLGVNGGASYDVVNHVFAPSINLKFGMAFGWKK
jgi:hypothetical protein